MKVAPRRMMPREMAMKWVAGRICEIGSRKSGSDDSGKM